MMQVLIVKPGWRGQRAVGVAEARVGCSRDYQQNHNHEARYQPTLEHEAILDLGNRVRNRRPIGEHLAILSYVSDADPMAGPSGSVTMAPKPMASQVYHDEHQRQHTDRGKEDLDS